MATELTRINTPATGDVDGVKYPDGNFQTSEIPNGAIAMWSGSSGSIPTGWLLCDGTNGTPDLRDRFVVGAGSSYSSLQTGGQRFSPYTLANVPPHDHTPATITINSAPSHNHGQKAMSQFDPGGLHTHSMNIGAVFGNPAILPTSNPSLRRIYPPSITPTATFNRTINWSTGLSGGPTVNHNHQVTVSGLLYTNLTPANTSWPAHNHFFSNSALYTQIGTAGPLGQQSSPDLDNNPPYHALFYIMFNSTATTSETRMGSAGITFPDGSVQTSALPAGTIIMHSSLTTFGGFAICNGSSGTPDLRDRFVVGAGSTYSLSSTGGQNSVSLTVQQIPPHNHTVGFSGQTATGSAGINQSTGSLMQAGQNPFGVGGTLANHIHPISIAATTSDHNHSFTPGRPEGYTSNPAGPVHFVPSPSPTTALFAGYQNVSPAVTSPSGSHGHPITGVAANNPTSTSDLHNHTSIQYTATGGNALYLPVSDPNRNAIGSAFENRPLYMALYHYMRI